MCFSCFILKNLTNSHQATLLIYQKTTFVFQFHIKAPRQKAVGRGIFQPDQQQGKPISSLVGQARRPVYYRSYKQNVAQHHSAELLRNGSGREANVPIARRYPLAVDDFPSQVQYYPDASYNSYPPEQSKRIVSSVQ